MACLIYSFIADSLQKFLFCGLLCTKESAMLITNKVSDHCNAEVEVVLQSGADFEASKSLKRQMLAVATAETILMLLLAESYNVCFKFLLRHEGCQRSRSRYNIFIAHQKRSDVAESQELSNFSAIRNSRVHDAILAHIQATMKNRCIESVVYQNGSWRQSKLCIEVVCSAYQRFNFL